MDMKEVNRENEDNENNTLENKNIKIDLSVPMNPTSQEKNLKASLDSVSDSEPLKSHWWDKAPWNKAWLKALLILFFFGTVLVLISFASCGIGRHFKMCPLPHYR